MGWLEGLLTGYQDRSHALAGEKMQEAMLANQREAQVYQTLLNSDDPEIRSMAATGMLQSGQNRRRQGGLQGWMGEMRGNPIYPKLQEYFRTPQEKITTALGTSLPSTQSSGYLPTPPAGQGSLAMPATSPTQAGAPPPEPPLPMPPPPGLAPLPPNETNPADRFEPPWGVAEPPPEEPPLFGTGAAVSPEVGAPPTPPPGAVPGAAAPTEPMLDVTYDAQGQPIVRGATSVDVTPPTVRSQVSPAESYERTTSHTVMPTFPSATDLKIGAERAEVAGKIAGLKDMFLAADPALSEQEASKMAADLYRQQTMRNFQGAFGTYVNRAAAELFPGLSMVDIQAQGGMPAVNQYASQLYAGDAAKRTTEVGAAKANVPLDKPGQLAAYNRAAASWETSTKDVRTQMQAVAQMKTALAAIDKRGDWAPAGEAIIVKWQKALDPPSVVRENEAERPNSFQGLVARAEGALLKLARGGASVRDIAAYVQLADEMASATAALTRNKRQQVSRILEVGGLDPWIVFGDGTLGLDEGEQPLTGPRTPGSAPAPAPAPTAAPATAPEPAPQAAAPAPGPAAAPFTADSIKPTPSHAATAATPPPRPSTSRPALPNTPGTLGARAPGVYVDRKTGKLVTR